MPKSYTDNERELIRRRLLEEAQACLTQYGLRKTTVDELVRRVNIPKGTFYLFYPSKELLFFELFCSLQEQLHRDLLSWTEELRGNVSVDSVTELLFRLYRQVDATFLYSFVAGGDLELLVRRLPPEVVAKHMEQDDFSMERLLRMLPVSRTEYHIKVFSAVLRAVFCTMLHRSEIGEEIFPDAVRILLRGVVMQLFEGGS